MEEGEAAVEGTVLEKKAKEKKDEEEMEEEEEEKEEEEEEEAAAAANLQQTQCSLELHCSARIIEGCPSVTGVCVYAR